MKALASITGILAKIPTRYQANMKQRALSTTTVILNYFFVSTLHKQEQDDTMEL